jgi:hypothetical protein
MPISVALQKIPWLNRKRDPSTPMAKEICICLWSMPEDETPPSDCWPLAPTSTVGLNVGTYTCHVAFRKMKRHHLIVGLSHRRVQWGLTLARTPVMLPSRVPFCTAGAQPSRDLYTGKTMCAQPRVAKHLHSLTSLPLVPPSADALVLSLESKDYQKCCGSA